MENKHTIYFNMCHHYRKILNAKAYVDTSSPKTLQFKTKKQGKSCQGAPMLYSKYSHRGTFRGQSKKPDLNVGQNRPYSICQCYDEQCYDYETRSNCENKSKPFLDAKLKCDSAKSKSRTSRVHCSPRKKCVQLKIHGEGASLQGESSDDSAYNEDECILSSDSRGSTPQSSIEKQEPIEKFSIKNSKSMSTAPSPPRSSRKDKYSVRTQFLKDITSDILQKQIYTNKAIRNVFQQHMKTNKYRLEKKTMLAGVMQLQEVLGVPTDSKFDNEDYGLGRIDLNVDKIHENENAGEGTNSTKISDSSAVVSKVENDSSSTDSFLLNDSEKDQVRDIENEYSDFSEENCNSEIVLSRQETTDSIVDKVAGSSQEDVPQQQFENKSEECSDVEYSLPKTSISDYDSSETDVEISEIY